jgi:hypothetical protein
MNRVPYFIALFFVLLLTTQINAQLFNRTAEIKEPSGLERGFGAVVAGVDFDGDGLPEIYAVNTNMIDEPYELIPRIYKFEWNPATATWDSVWGAIAPLELQNTWPALTWGDLDKDGRPELYWAPINYSPYPELPRILVYEYPGDGSDNMGVDDGFGGFLPNAKTPILAGDGQNIRPVRMVVTDVDGDGTDELIFADRQGSSTSDFHLGVMSVNDIPDNGSGLEEWTIEFSGVGDPYLSGTGNNWDVVVIPPYISVITGDGRAALIKYESGNWNTLQLQSGIAGGNNSFKGMLQTKFDDGSIGVYVGSWFSSKVYYIYKPDDVDTLISYEIADFAPYAVRLNGAGVGDLDSDGLPDMVFGARYMATNTTKVPIFRLEYQGGDKTSPLSYQMSIIDSAYWDMNGDMDVIVVANVDGDKSDEVLYTQGYSRGNATDQPMPLIVLDLQFTPVSVKIENNLVPAQFYLDQNFPNPFNPSTEIKFGITEASNVDLRIYDALGREVAVLINGEYLSAGSYSVKFDASKLASGNYVYKMTAGANTVSRKMQLLK